MSTENNIKKRILETARLQFFRSGYTKVTTDEIAAELGISKKTLYKHFPSKEKLLREVMEMTLVEFKSGVDGILLNERTDFVEKLKQLMNFLGGQISKTFTRPFLNDIQKNAPEIWKKVEAFREKNIHTTFANLIDEGIDKGLFRSDVDQRLLVLIYFNAIQHTINPEVLSQLPFSTSEVFETIIKVIFEGILTDKARTKIFTKEEKQIP
jgi:AcrR family transcriptional regulator